MEKEGGRGEKKEENERKDRKKSERKKVDDERRGDRRGSSLDSNGACFVPDLKKHSEKRISCSLLLRMTLTHTERIFIKTLCICIVVMERRQTVFLPGFRMPG